ncbi:MAG: RNA-binding protein [Lachnospiraceae bacterium]|nr:RNA-binding protein [Lachnospiraceae bacterium]
MNTEKEELITKKRLMESAQLAFQKEIVVYTDFLGLAEQNLFYSAVKEFPPVCYSCYGGTKEAERFCIAFDGREAVSGLKQTEAEEFYLFPVVCLAVTPSSLKYSEVLTHRDYLGALLHLGITRSKIGDIFIRDGQAYVFCMESIADFICKELCTVKHTLVHCEIITPEEELLRPELKEMTGTVASLRLDAFLSVAFQTSRSSLAAFIDAGKTFVNGRLVTKAGHQLEEGDIVSVRGKGRFKVTEIKNLTKKGRIVVTINKYI